jgi:hypothetical protein
MARGLGRRRRHPHVWLVYSGATVALGSADVWSDGWRLRAGGGYGGYSLSEAVSGPHGLPYLVHYSVQTAYADGLIGYLKRLGPLTAKAFVGAAMISHSFAAEDIGSTSTLAWGPKAALELWLNIGESAWASLDLNGTTACSTYAGRLRLGYRVLPTLSVGPEAAINHDEISSKRCGGIPEANAPLFEGRAGLFVRYEWFGGEASVAGGFASNFDRNLGSAAALTDTIDARAYYGNVNWVTQF